MRITWDDLNRDYTRGVSQGVLYPENSPGVAWNGLLSVKESGGQSQEARYFDGRKYLSRGVSMAFSGTISAFTYPAEFEPYAGNVGVFTGQSRQLFGFSYRTNNAIHLVYNVLASSSPAGNSSISDKISPVAFEWGFTTLPVKIPGGKPSSHLVIIVDDSHSEAITALEALIYGDDVNDPVLPSPADIVEIFESYTTLRITDNGDGTWTATAAGSIITITGGTTFTIDWPSAIFTDSTTYQISSL
jgi:hypothetical protein